MPRTPWGGYLVAATAWRASSAVTSLIRFRLPSSTPFISDTITDGIADVRYRPRWRLISACGAVDDGRIHDDEAPVVRGENLERIGDHTTNIAETVHYMIEGRTIAEDRPKGDTTTFATLATEK